MIALLSRPRLTAVLVAIATGLGLVLAGAASTAGATDSSSSFPFCGWWALTTADSVNVALPDTSAGYWTTPFQASPGLKILISGRFPDARFMSVTVYDNNGGTFSVNGVSSSLDDYQIKPEPGTSNPYQETASDVGTFTVKIERRVSGRQKNVLPMLPAGETSGIAPPGTGFIVYRIYLPSGGTFSSVKLPTVTLSRAGSTQALPTCPWIGGSAATGSQSSAALRLPALRSARNLPVRTQRRRAFASGYSIVPFFRPKAATTNSFFPNPANAYLAATFYPVPGSVVVVRGEAASAPPGASALPWPDSAYDLRYWSLCNNLDRKPFPVVSVKDPQTGDQLYGCSADLDTPVVNGDYTYVLSSLAERPPNAAKDDGVTWLPYANGPGQELLVFRNMLGGGFGQSVQKVAQDGNPASAQAVMGPYYPAIAQCSVATFRKGGASACFASARG